MNRRRWASARTGFAALATGTLLGATLVTGGPASAHLGSDGSIGWPPRNPDQHQVFGQLIAAAISTARYLDIDVATAAGFAELKDADGIACIDNPAGGMGVHYVDGSRLDGAVDVRRPEVLVYEPGANGSMRLVALEYVVFASDWKGDRPPTLYGRSFEYMPGQDEPGANRYGLPAFWELHAWVWKHNPNGLFEDWNPRVTCR